MKKKSIILIGGGGHCKSCIEVIESTSLYHIEGILDVPEKMGKNICGYQIIGTDDEVDRFVKAGFVFLITIGHIKSSSIRQKIFKGLSDAGGKLETIIADSAKVSSHAVVGEGTIIMHKGFVNAGAQIGKNCIINTGSVIEHDAIVGDHSHISTMGVVNGDVTIGTGTFIGSNAVVNQSLQVGDEIIVGSGSVVNKHITERGTYVGNPVKKIS